MHEGHLGIINLSLITHLRVDRDFINKISSYKNLKLSNNVCGL